MNRRMNHARAAMVIMLCGISALHFAPAVAAQWPEWGLSMNSDSFGNRTAGLSQALRKSAPTLSPPGTVTSIDSADSDPTSGDVGFSLLLRYDLGSYLTLEANYSSASTLGSGNTGIFVSGRGIQDGRGLEMQGLSEINADVIGLSLLGYWPIWHGLNIQGRVGADRINTTVDTLLHFGPQSSCRVQGALPGICGWPTTFRDTSTVPAFGVGFTWRFGHHGRVGLEYQRTLNFGNAQTTGRYTLSNIGVSFSINMRDSYRR